MPDFISHPGREDLSPKRRLQFGALGSREIGPVTFGEQRGDAVVLVDQGAARDFRGVRGQHQFDLQCTDSLVESGGRDPA